MKYQISLIVGDRWRDGHGMSETVMIQSSHSSSDILSAISLARKCIPFLTDLCSNYGDCRIANDDYLRLKELGISMGSFCLENDSQILDPDDYINMYLSIIESHLPGFSYKKVKSEEVPLGGYGLFE